jgi:hypothetical protein
LGATTSQLATSRLCESQKEFVGLADFAVSSNGPPENVEFILATIRTRNTHLAYARVVRGFLESCEARGLTPGQIEPVVMAVYIEQHSGSRPTVKQHLAAVRMLFDWLVTGPHTAHDGLPLRSVQDQGPTNLIAQTRFAVNYMVTTARKRTCPFSTRS